MGMPACTSCGKLNGAGVTAAGLDDEADNVAAS